VLNANRLTSRSVMLVRELLEAAHSTMSARIDRRLTVSAILSSPIAAKLVRSSAIVRRRRAVAASWSSSVACSPIWRLSIASILRRWSAVPVGRLPLVARGGRRGGERRALIDAQGRHGLREGREIGVGVVGCYVQCSLW